MRRSTAYTNCNNPSGRHSGKSVYDAPLVHEFLKQYITTELHLTSRSIGEIKKLNGKRMSADDSRRHLKWATQKHIGLALVDSYLTRYGLMTWELEDWCEKHHGWNGFIEAAGAGELVS